jgi:ATP-binding cassette, subfamily B, bacterial RamB/AmfA
VSASMRTAKVGGIRSLVHPVLAAHRRELLMIGGWSVAEAVPLLASGWLVAAAVDRGFLAGAPDRGIALLACYAALLVVGAFATRQVLVPIAVIADALRDRVVRAVVQAALQDAVVDDRPPDAGAVARVTSQAELARRLTAAMLIVARTTAFGTSAAVLGLAGLVPIVALVTVPALGVATLLVVRLSRRWRREYEQSLAAEEWVAERATHVLGGLRDVLACGACRRVLAELDGGVADHAAAAVRVAQTGAWRIGAITMGARIPLVALLVLAPGLINSGTMTAGEVLGAATYLVVGLEPAVRSLVQAVGNLGLELGTVLRRLAAVGGGRAPVTPRDGGRTDAFGLALRDVTFRYGPHSAPVLSGANLTIAHGDHVGVVGPSGVGKSTLAMLLTGLARPERGQVLVGDEPIHSLDARWLAVTVVLVPQEAYVFAGSVRENLSYLAEDSTDAELDAAAHAVGAADLVARLGGLGATVERPATLSAGERQLLVLARAYASRAEIVILDEATCHLDPVAEEQAEAAFAARPGTLILIAHRISSALRADRIVVLDGASLNVGTHEDLIRRCPTYADLIGSWTSPGLLTSSGPDRKSRWRP